MSETIDSGQLIGPTVKDIAFKRIIRTRPTTGELVDVNVLIYSVTDTKSNSVRGRDIQYYECLIKENTSEDSVDNDRAPLQSLFEITHDINALDNVFENIVQGAIVPIPSDATFVQGLDIVHYYELMHGVTMDVSNMIAGAERSGAFDFDPATYNDNVYDHEELDRLIEQLVTKLSDSAEVGL